jgi:hypothetical protein
VIAADGAGNLSAPSAERSAVVTGDVTAPAVAMTAPAAGARVSGANVSVTAAASDNVGVADVQFRLDGAALGSPDTSSPYALTWDTRTVPDGAHSLTAVARDAAGNTTTSAAVAVTVENAVAPPVGLVAAYGFEETTGTTATDSSASGLNGTISGPTRVTTGRFGSALNFDGVNDIVNIADANALDLTNGMTLEAWVNPAAITGWRTVLLKEKAGDLVYGLYSNSDLNRPTAHVQVGGDRSASGTAQVALNTWTHLAATYDGTTVRLYVGGTQVGTRAVSGAMAASTQPLRIGGNTIWTAEWFSGRLDEIRVYNRALTAAEIQTDMGRAVKP